ncbi:glycoside hydrolase family 5 protein [Lactarius indigo]|nr:glycoside hydrolase family 5 protein [Lactarius indigo]
MWNSQLPFAPGFLYGSQPVRGVNLGGWLVLEPWITPSLFDNTGNPAYHPHVALAKLTDHWNNWITQNDFAKIAAAGLNHVRIPIGYWAYDVAPGEPYLQGQRPYLAKAISWAQQYGLKVIIDLHGAPGSQNGYAHRSSRPSVLIEVLPALTIPARRCRFPQWQSSQTNIDRTNAVIRRIAYEFRNNYQVVSVIAPLNEPAGFFGQQILDATRQYWHDSYGSIRNTTAFAMDTHIYQIIALDNAGHIRSACSNEGSLSDFNHNQLWTIVGEWTPAMTDCAKYLNWPRHPGAPSYGNCNTKTGSGASFSQDYRNFLRMSWEAQVTTYEKASGWIQWTWKTEQADDWSYSAGLQYGWIPWNPEDREYPNICN